MIAVSPSRSRRRSHQTAPFFPLHERRDGVPRAPIGSGPFSGVTGHSSARTLAPLFNSTEKTPMSQDPSLSARWRRRAVLRAGLAATAAAPWPAALAAGPTVPRAPAARIEPVSETFFGTTVVDPYRWMENPKDKDWEPYMRAQDAHARATLAAIPGRDALARRVAALSGGTAVAYGVQSAGGRVFYQVRPAGADNFKLAVRQGLGGAERVLIDPTTMKGEGGVHVSLDWWAASPDGRHVVYGLSPAGSENSVLHVMEVQTMRVLPERIAGTQYAAPSWLPDGSGFFYRRLADPSKLGSVDYYKRAPVLLHTLGRDPKDDVLVVVHGRDASLPSAETDLPAVFASRSGGPWAVLGLFGGVRRENPLFVAPLADALAGRAAWKPVCTIEDEVVDFAFDADTLYLLSTKDAPNGKVLRTPLASATYKDASTVVPEGPLVVEALALARDALYLQDLDGGYHSVRKLGRDGKLASVPLPWEGSINGLSASTLEDGCWLDGTGWLLPFTTFRHDPASGRTERAGIAPPSSLDLSGYEAIRTFASARDGTKVPLSIVARKGLKRDGRNPTLVAAYGAYQITSGPYFSPRTLALLERGGVFATAHVRGGGEYGKRWWKGGQKLTKPNTWRDLIDCCEHLVRERWASKATLTIQGGSAGGITVGRALTERPELFAGVISNVGVSNPLRAEFAQNGPPNIAEFGSVADKDGFAGLLAMDALAHVKDGTRYPAVLLTIGMTDSRVEAWQGGKMAARLQKANASRNPILLRVDFDAGHGLGSTRRQIDEERADEFAFVLWRAGRQGVR
jgi:prolyl oligopeptidase